MPFEFMTETEPTPKKRRFSLFGSSHKEPKLTGRVFVVDSLDFSRFEESAQGFDSRKLHYGEEKDIPVDWAFSHFHNKEALKEFSRLIGEEGFKPSNSYEFWSYRPGDTIYLVTLKEEFDWVTKVVDEWVEVWEIYVK